MLDCHSFTWLQETCSQNDRPSVGCTGLTNLWSSVGVLLPVVYRRVVDKIDSLRIRRKKHINNKQETGNFLWWPCKVLKAEYSIFQETRPYSALPHSMLPRKQTRSATPANNVLQAQELVRVLGCFASEYLVTLRSRRAWLRSFAIFFSLIMPLPSHEKQILNV